MYIPEGVERICLDAYKADFNWGVYNICPIPE